jgi:class 3 adenylate cyclase
MATRPPVRVRIGIHSGAPAIVGADYVGRDVHRAARISTSAHGGQIVLFDATRALLSRGDRIDSSFLTSASIASRAWGDPSSSSRWSPRA